jgi:nucleosome binding factor SPN SPT16 subunit
VKCLRCHQEIAYFFFILPIVKFSIPFRIFAIQRASHMVMRSIYYRVINFVCHSHCVDL